MNRNWVLKNRSRGETPAVIYSSGRCLTPLNARKGNELIALRDVSTLSCTTAFWLTQGGLEESLGPILYAYSSSDSQMTHFARAMILLVHEYNRMNKEKVKDNSYRNNREPSMRIKKMRENHVVRVSQKVL